MAPAARTYRAGVALMMLAFFPVGACSEDGKGDGDIWQRRVTVSQILAFYRRMYTPRSTSPLVDQGDPTDDTGGMRNTDIGAVGAGNPHPDDLFGTFGK